MAEFRGNTNGERNGWAKTEENPMTAFQRGSFPSQFSPESRHRVDEEHLFGFPSQGFDIQTLDSSFNRLSIFDSKVHHHQFPLPDNRWTNRSPSLHNVVINDGGRCGGYLFPPPRNNQFPTLSFQNDPSTSSMLNHGFFNRRDVPYLSRNRFSDERYNPSNVSLAKDRVSSQNLQDKIIECSIETFDMIFNDVIFHIFDLMVDPFGNQVIEKLIERCSSRQISQILDMIIHHQYQFVTVCNDSIGTQAIRLLLRCLHSQEQIVLIVKAISRVTLTLTRNNHAKLVILECFNQFSPLYNMSLIQIISQNCYWIAIDQHGCCMLQQCLSIGCYELKQRLISEIINNALRLCVNCYGNYVVQYLVELDERDVTKELIRTLIGNFGYISRNKYGSHVVQKFLKVKDIDYSRLIVKELFKDIDTLLVDPFGNYVIQTAWFVSQDDMRCILGCHIKNHSRFLRCNKFGIKILEKLKI